MNKLEKIEKYLQEPFVPGDRVIVKGLGIQNKDNWGDSATIKYIEFDGSLTIEYRGSLCLIKKEDYKKSTCHIGENPFVKNHFLKYAVNHLFDLSGLLSFIGYDRETKEIKLDDREIKIPKVSFDPFIVKDGKTYYYQRDLVWSLAQKQALISSIFHGKDIGKFLIRKRSWEKVGEYIKQGMETSFKDVVDGKQRLNAILECLQNIFEVGGVYFEELSDAAQREFYNFSSFSLTSLGEQTEDKDVLEAFLNVNVAGVKVDEDVIKNVQDILNLF